MLSAWQYKQYYSLQILPLFSYNCLKRKALLRLSKGVVTRRAHRRTLLKSGFHTMMAYSHWLQGDFHWRVKGWVTDLYRPSPPASSTRPWQAKENKDIPIQDWHCILSQSHCAPVLLHTCSQLCNCTTPINTKGVVCLQQMRIRMINNMQIWHHNNPKYSREKNCQSPCFVGSFSSLLCTNIFSLKPLAINKASLPSITEAQMFRAVDMQQKDASYLPVALALCLQCGDQRKEMTSQYVHSTSLCSLEADH